MFRRAAPTPVGLALWLLPLLFGISHASPAPVEALQRDGNPSPVPPMVQYQWTAFGDSYAAGVGAGSRSDVPGGGTGGSCRRSMGAFPVQLGSSPFLTTNSSHAFQFLACSGASIESVLRETPDSQINRFRSNSPANNEYAIITLGGNDVGFAALAATCLYRARDGCEEEKAKTRARLQTIGADLVRVYAAIIDAATDGGTRNLRFLLNVIGYTRFFNDVTTGCNNATFAIFPHTATPESRLTTHMRREINSFVLGMNDVIREAVETVNRQFGFEAARYVDVDLLFEGHRFCEGNQTEPLRDDNTWFFLLNTGATDAPVDTQSPPPNNAAVRLALSSFKPADLDFDFVIRALHPKSRGHQAIKEMLEQEIQNRREQRLCPVLIMYKGDEPSFESMIRGLRPLPGLAAGRTTRRWQQANHDLRGYSTWLSAAAGHDLMRDNPNVLGVSYERRLVFTESSLSSSQSSARANFAYRKNSTDEAVRRPNRRQVSADALSLQRNDEDGFDHWGLQYLSSPPKHVGMKYWEYPGYVHAPDGGRNVDIYCIGTGVNAVPDEFGDRIKDHFEASETTPGLGDLYGHGTRIASAAAGNRGGTSKAATIIPVKITDSLRLGKEHLAAHQLFEALQWVISDVIITGLSGKAVINYSLGNLKRYDSFANPYVSSDHHLSDPWFHILPILAAHGITVVTAAGDDSHPDSDVVEYSPARYALNGEVGADTLIVIGSSDRTGDEARFSNRFSSAITAYAPGEDILVLGHDGGYDVHSGTWISAALVSGIIANWLARPDMTAKLDMTGTPPGDFTKKVKALVKEAALYATDPSSHIKIVGTYDYIPCTPPSAAEASGANPTRYTVRDAAGIIHHVPDMQCVGTAQVHARLRSRL